jgi:hypothetical protein
MTIENFIKLCGESIKDSTFIVTKQQEWLEILNTQVNELFPDIAIINNVVVEITSSSYTPQIDMSDCENIIGIKAVYLIDDDGNKTLFNNWSYDRDIKLLILNNDLSDTTASTGDSIQVVWMGEMTEKTKYDEEITLNNSQIQLLKKACLKEVLTRLLMDRMKLDRYKTLSGSANEYVLMAMQKTYSEEVEFAKRKKNNSLRVRSI